jgi:putative endonuclease
VPHARRLLGDQGEQLAKQFLLDRGYAIVQQNYRCPEGEIDLVCRDGDSLAFVEVKTRRGSAFGNPEEAVTAAKLRHIAAAAARYLSEQPLGDVPWRIDVVAVALDATGRMEEIRLLRNAGLW